MEGAAINRNVRHISALFSVGLILSILLVACGGEEEAPPPTRTPLPRPTSTPRSTPLPDVDLPVILGSQDKPVSLLFVISSPESEQEDAIDTLQDQLTDQLGDDEGSLTVEVGLLATPREAIDALCAGQPAMIWVDVFTYIAAERECGAMPVFGVRQTRQIGINGLAFDIVYDRRVLGNVATPDMLRNRIICRIQGDDTPLNWVYPSLAMRAAGVDPVTGIQGVVEVANAQALVRAIFEEECVAGAIPNDQLETLVRRLQGANPPVTINQREGAPDVVVMLDGQETWPEIPHGVLIAPPDFILPESFRELIITTLQEVIDGEEDEALKELVPYAEIVPRTPNDYAEFRAWLEAARWSMSD